MVVVVEKCCNNNRKDKSEINVISLSLLTNLRNLRMSFLITS